MSIFVDVSKYQGINGAPIPKLLAAGAHGVIAKATQGTFTDPAFAANSRQIVASGAPGGYFHFLEPDIDSAGHPKADGAKQAEYFWSTVKGVVRPLDALVCDVERGGRPAPTVAFAFGRRLAQLAGSRCRTLYTSRGFWEGHGNPDATQSFDVLWLAFYTEFHQPLDANVDVSSVSHKAHGLAGFRTTPLVQFGPLVFQKKRYDGNHYDDAADWRTVMGDGGAVKPPVPITDRPRYRAGYITAAAVFEANVKGANIPDPGNGPAWEAGVEAARQDALDALTSVTLGDPPANTGGD